MRCLRKQRDESAPSGSAWTRVMVYASSRITPERESGPGTRHQIDLDQHRSDVRTGCLAGGKSRLRSKSSTVRFCWVRAIGATIGTVLQKRTWLALLYGSEGSE